MNSVIIGIGSNILPEEHIEKALVEMKKSLMVIKTTCFIITKPIGITDQPDFLNGALKAETMLEMEDLRLFLKAVEDRLGRDRTAPKFGSRTIDLDIVLWNGTIVDDDYYTRDYLQQLISELI
jgi:2-amino-4-hydroxy-6-hydroxymethyldihydropteridine diphosphokinase